MVATTTVAVGDVPAGIVPETPPALLVTDIGVPMPLVVDCWKGELEKLPVIGSGAPAETSVQVLMPLTKAHVHSPTVF